MPFWKREVELPTPAARPVPPPLRPEVHGSLACSERGCTRHDAAACAYVDRRRRQCPTAWCPDHQVVLAGRAYCRRHSRITAASLADEYSTPNLPDLDNRSPSLADYCGDALEPRVMGFLRDLRRPGSGDRVGAEPLRVVQPAGGGSRCWERAWKLYDHTGVHARVAVEVDESHDPEVWIRVGRQLVARAVPPWISRRRDGLTPLDDHADAELRERFYASLWGMAVPHLVAELDQNRATSP
jgi:hypothetical protein